ncbi:MAG: KH domain-containing protein [Terriglobales bacterium]
MKQLIEGVVRGLVAQPEAVTVTEKSEGPMTVLEVHAAAADLGRLIGTHGRTVRSLRTLLAAAARHSATRYRLEIDE